VRLQRLRPQAFLIGCDIWLMLCQCYDSFQVFLETWTVHFYIYAFARCFYPKRLTLHWMCTIYRSMNSLGMITSGMKLSPVVCGCFWSCFFASVCVCFSPCRAHVPLGIVGRVGNCWLCDCKTHSLHSSSTRFSQKTCWTPANNTHTFIISANNATWGTTQEFGEIRFRLVLISQSSTLSEKKVQKLSLGLYLFKR